MKKQVYILGLALLILLALFFVDRVIFMKKRVLRYYLWEHAGSERIRGDFIDTENVTFKGNTMIFDREDTLILKYQYFSTMKVFDPKTGKTGKYSMEGAGWADYLFRGKK